MPALKMPRADSGRDLRHILRGNHRFVFSLIHKFNRPVTEPYSERDDVIVSAVGQRPDLSSLDGDLARDAEGSILVDAETCATSRRGRRHGRRRTKRRPRSGSRSSRRRCRSGRGRPGDPLRAFGFELVAEQQRVVVLLYDHERVAREVGPRGAVSPQAVDNIAVKLVRQGTPVMIRSVRRPSTEQRHRRW